MIKKIMQDALNNQLAKEFYSSNLYLSMAAYFKSINLNGFANWMRVQAQEEMFHAMRFFDYILERGGHAVVEAIPSPPNKWKGPLEIFEDAFKHEQMVTESISKIADLAIKESDHATSIFMHWFITEQVEEEANAYEIIDRIKLAGDSKAGLFMLDNELKARVFVPPPNAGITPKA